MLQILSERRADSWTVHWLLGKAWHAIDDSPRAYSSLIRAYELERENQVVTRELAGVCLELGKTTEAVSAAERAVAGDPENGELLTNLALAYLLDERLSEAERTIAAAFKHAEDDPVAEGVKQLLCEVQSGTRPQPKTLSDLATPPSRPSLWQSLLQAFRRQQ